MPSLSEPSAARRLTRDEKRQQTRQQLRESALRAVVTHGLAGASVDTISESAGYSRGAFYGNYETKEELLLETMVERLNKEAQAWERLVVEASDVESMLAEVEKRMMSRAHPEWAVLTLELQLHAHRDRAFGRSFAALLRQHNAAAARLYQAMFEKAGRVPPDDLRAIAASGFALGVGLTLQAETGIRPGDSRYAARMYMLYLRGLIAIAEPVGTAVAAAPAPRKRAAKVARSS
jgi:AcrR family transcriptional regulator